MKAGADDCRIRFQAALDCKKPDRVPIWENNIDEKSIIDIARILSGNEISVKADNFGYERSDAILELYCLIIRELDFDATSSHFSVGLNEIAEGVVKDKYGVIYQLSGHGEAVVIDGPVNNREDIRNFDMTSKLDIEKDCRSTRYFLEQFGTTKSHVFDVLDPFKTSWCLRGGMEKLLFDYYENPLLVHDLAKIATDHCIATIEMGITLGVDTIALIGDLAGNGSSLMSPEHFNEFVLPYEKNIVAFAHDNGLKVIKHSDGNLWPIMDLLMEAGFDGMHPIQPQCMSIKEFKEKYDGQVCILGNIDCEELLCTGSVEEVKKTVVETMNDIGATGGYVVCSSNSIHSGVNPRNYLAMIETARRFRSVV